MDNFIKLKGSSDWFILVQKKFISLHKDLLTDKAFRLYCLLKSYCAVNQEELRAFPSQQHIAHMLGWNIQTIIKVTKELKELKLLEVEQYKDPLTGKFSRNIYILQDDRVWLNENQQYIDDYVNKSRKKEKS